MAFLLCRQLRFRSPVEIDQVILDEALHYPNSRTRPIVAKRHYIETESRWLSVEFVPLDDLISMDETEGEKL